MLKVVTSLITPWLCLKQKLMASLEMAKQDDYQNKLKKE